MTHPYRKQRGVKQRGVKQRGVLKLLCLLSASVMLPAESLAATGGASEVVLEEIVVTGTRIKRRDAIAPSPIFTLDRDDLFVAPQPTLEESLNRLPQITPDFGRSSNNPGDGTARLNLRGMGSERTLVLMNARRIAPSGVGNSVDINNIPQILLERVELVTGGASAVYGSDALAGVVNFITRDDFSGVMLEASYGLTDRGDAEFTDLSLALGTDLPGDRGNITLFSSFYDRESLFAGERELTSVALRESGSGELFNGGSFATPESAIFSAVPGLGFPTFQADGTPRAFINPDDQFNAAPVTYLQTPLRRYSGGVLGKFVLKERTEIYLESTFSRNEAATELAPVPAVAPVNVNTDNPLLAPETAQLFQDNFTDPTSEDPNIASFTIGRRLSELGPRRTDFERDYWRTVVGVRSEFKAGWSLDAWVSYTEANEDALLRNDASVARLRQGLLVDADTGQCFDPANACSPIDLFGPGRISPAAINFLRYQPLRNKTKRSQRLASMFINGSPLDTWAGPVDLAVGLEWRSDRVRFTADDALFTDDTLGYLGDAPVSGTEKTREAYAEFVLPLVSTPDGIRVLTAEVGARYSDFENAGDDWTYKAGLSLEPSRSLLVRSMWQRSVRAPNNRELFQREFREQGNFVGNFVLPDPCSASQDPVANGFADACILQGLPADQLGVFEATPFLPVDFIRGGNAELDPELAKTLTIGFVFAPESRANWEFGADYYDIEITDSIGEISARDICFDQANNSDLFCSNIRRVTDPMDSAFGNVFEVSELFSNRGQISTEGIDLQLRFSQPLPDSLALFEGGAELSGSLIWTHLLESKFQGSPVSSVDSCAGFFSSPCSGVESSSTAAENRAVASLTYTSEQLRASIVSRWISGTRSYLFAEAEADGSPAPILARPRVSDQLYVDLNASYQFGANTVLRLGVFNLFDNKAPITPDELQNTDSQLFDVFGRAFNLSLRVSFGGST